MENNSDQIRFAVNHLDVTPETKCASDKVTGTVIQEGASILIFKEELLIEKIIILLVQSSDTCIFIIQNCRAILVPLVRICVFPITCS